MKTEKIVILQNQLIEMGCGYSGSATSPSQQNSLKDQHTLRRQKTNQLKVEHRAFVKKNEGKLEDDYRIENKIGQGHFGIVKKVVCKSNDEERAVKIIQKSTDARNKTALLEIEFLCCFDHPHILKIFEFYEDETNYYVVMELLRGGELFERISEGKCLTEKGAQDICRQILSAINYAHSLNIMHRDLKPENILLEIDSNYQFNIKVVDWGGAIRFEKNQVYDNYFGTKFYMSPEQLCQKYNYKCDLWSIGVILYILISGESPFGNQNVQKQILKKNYKFYKDSWENISEQCIDLVKKLMCDQDSRLTAQQALNHPWFQIALTERPSTSSDERKEELTQSKLLDKNEQRKNLVKLKQFQTNQKFETAVLNYIAFKMISSKEYNYLRDQFKMFDLNGDGTLTRDEIKQAYQSICSKKELKQIDFEEMFASIDIDNNGVINFTEFLSATMDKENVKQTEKIKSAFKYFDMDQNGFITKNELNSILFKGDQTEDTNFLGLWTLILDQSDKNKDGQIEFDEFVSMMNQYASAQTESTQKETLNKNSSS